MQKRFVNMALIALFVVTLPAFADQGTYKLESNAKTFDISYNFDGELLAIAADQESTSLLIGTQNVRDSMFTISFSSELLSAQNAEFIVLVDGLETDYTITYGGNNPTITFPIPTDSEEIEIIGTNVVPEFPFGALAILGALSIGIFFSKMRLNPFK